MEIQTIFHFLPQWKIDLLCLILNNSKSYTEENFTSNFIDNENKIARITTFMKDISTIRIEEIEKELTREINEIFPKDR